jgi:hypothetical protein
MERVNGEVRNREKVMRSLKITTTPILPGYQLFRIYQTSYGIEWKKHQPKYAVLESNAIISG